MKKLFAICGLALLMAIPASAQFSWGIRAGVNAVNNDITAIDKESVVSKDSYTGFFAGPMMEVQIPIIGIGIGVGEDRAIEAAKQAVSSPLLETSIVGATDAIINVTGGSSLTLFEAEDAAEVVRASANTDINIIFGAVINENLNDEVIVTVIATGFEQPSEPLYHSFTNTTRENLYKEVVENLKDTKTQIQNNWEGDTADINDIII